MTGDKLPPLGVRLTVDVELVDGHKGTVCKARVRWTDPTTHQREGIKRVFDTRVDVDAWLARMRQTAETGLNPGLTLDS